MNKVHKRSFVVISAFFTSHFQASLDSLLVYLGRKKKLGLAIKHAELRLYRVCSSPPGTTRLSPPFLEGRQNSIFKVKTEQMSWQQREWCLIHLHFFCVVTVKLFKCLISASFCFNLIFKYRKSKKNSSKK